ncbi:MAG: hypothetical protein KC910_01530 [Candidatus Eremiobacteraeota bacterium]|nr:hypothetical protein [Candidatus Eremiobacteraeota bacterium]
MIIGGSLPLHRSPRAVHRAPLRPVEPAPDRVELSPGTSSPAVATERALDGFPLGAAGAGLAQELAALPCDFLVKKSWHFPWTSAHRKLSPEQAAVRLEKGDESLRVQSWGEPLPLRNLDELAAFEHLEFGLTHRPAPEGVEQAAKARLALDQRGNELSLYQAYLEPASSQLVMNDDDWQTANLPQAQTLLAKAPPSHRVRAAQALLSQGQSPTQAQARLAAAGTQLARLHELALLEGSPTAVEARAKLAQSGLSDRYLKNLGKQDEEWLLKLAQSAQGLTSHAGSLRELVARGKQADELGQAFDLALSKGASPVVATAQLLELRPALERLGYTSQIRSAGKAYGEVVAGQPDCVHDLFCDTLAEHKSGDLARSAAEQVLAPCGSLSVSERVAAFRELAQKKYAPFNEAYQQANTFKAFRAEVEAGSTPREAYQRLATLAEWVNQAGLHYRSEVTSVLASYGQFAAGPAAAIARQRSQCLLTKGIGGSEFSTALEQVHDVGEQHWDFYQHGVLENKTLNQSGVRSRVFGAYLAERAAGTQDQTARARLDRIPQAFAQRSSHYRSDVTEAFASYGRHLAGGQELEPARDLLDQMIQEGVGAAVRTRVLSLCLEPVANLTLDQKVGVARQLFGNPQELYHHDYVRVDLLDCAWTDIRSGTSPETTLSRLDRLAQPGQWKSAYDLRAALQAYRQNLCGGEELQPVRDFLLELRDAGIKRNEAVQASAQLTADNLQDYRDVIMANPKFNQDGLRGEVFESYRQERAAGTDAAQAKQRLQSLLAAHEQAGYGRRYDLQESFRLYHQSAIGSPSLRDFLADLPGRGVVRSEARSAVAWVARGHSQLDERIKLYQDVFVKDGYLNSSSLRGDVLKTIDSRLERQSPAELVQDLKQLEQTMKAAKLNSRQARVWLEGFALPGAEKVQTGLLELIANKTSEKEALARLSELTGCQ